MYVVWFAFVLGKLSILFTICLKSARKIFHDFLSLNSLHSLPSHYNEAKKREAKKQHSHQFSFTLKVCGFSSLLSINLLFTIRLQITHIHGRLIFYLCVLVSPKKQIIVKYLNFMHLLPHKSLYIFTSQLSAYFDQNKQITQCPFFNM